jgi:hypothetical protein
MIIAVPLVIDAGMVMAVINRGKKCNAEHEDKTKR